MGCKSRITIAKFGVIAAAIPVLIYAYEYGPDAGHAGVPGENGTCAVAGCHVGTANSGQGSVKVAFPAGLTYTPGVKQHLVVTVADPSQRRWGFQLTARLKSDSKAQAGTFAPTDNFTQVMCASADLVSQNPVLPCPANMPLQYIEQTATGSRLGTTGSASFEFDWTPPASDVGQIVIYVAGNAANGNNLNTGDLAW
jgi:hypothetical protein